jgi:hypothetical protein
MAFKGEIKKLWRQGRDINCKYQTSWAQSIFEPGPASGVSIKNVRERSEGEYGYARGLTASCNGFGGAPTVRALELAVSTLPKKKTY